MKRTLLILCAFVSTLVVQAQNPYPIVAIDTLQYVTASKLLRTPPNDSADYVNPVKRTPYGDTVRFEGIVLMDARAYGLSTSRKGTYIQRTGGGAWAGVLALADPGVVLPAGATVPNFLAETKFYDNLKPGYRVRLTGVWRQFNISTALPYGETQIDMIHDNANFSNSVEVLSITPTVIPPTVLTIDTFMTGNPVASNVVQKKATGEKYEGMYVEFQNVTVYTRTASGSRWVWSVIDDNGNAIQIRDFSGYFRNDGLEDTSLHIAHTFAPPPIGARLSYIRGAVTEANSNSVVGYWLSPLNPTDIGSIAYTPPAIASINRTPVVAGPTDSVLFSVKTIRGSRGIQSGRLYSTVGYNSFVFDSVAMTRSTLDSTVWTAKVPNKPANSVVKYWIKFIDSNSVFRNFPDSLGTNSSYLVTPNGTINTIAQLQFSPYASVATIWNGDSIPAMNINGIVTGINFMSGTGASAQSLITIQNGTGPNSAIYIQRAATNDVTANWAIGDSVNIISAKVWETFNVTTLNSISATKIAGGKTLPAFANNLSMDSFRLNNVHYARPYEGVLMHWDSIVVYNPNPDGPSSNFYEFSFSKDTLAALGLRVDDMNSSIHNVSSKIKKGMVMNYIQGPMFFSHNDFKLIPRSLADIDLSHLDSIAPVVTLRGKAIDTVIVNRTWVDSGATAIDNIDGNITAKIIKTGTVNTATIGVYTINYIATDNWGNTGIATRTVRVVANTAVKEAELLNASITVYPSPATNEITVSASGIQTLPVSISIIDLIGRQVMSRQVKQGNFSATFDISTLQNGIYFCVLSNDKGSRTVKFVVNGK
jgi:hypothetical protein